MKRTSFQTVGREDIKPGLILAAGPISFVIIVLLFFLGVLDASFFSTYPISLLDSYGWYLILLLLVSLMVLTMVESERSNHVTIFQIESSDPESADHGEMVKPREIKYQDLSKGKKKERTIDVKEVKNFPNEPLFWNPPTGALPLTVPGTRSTLKIISQKGSNRNLILGFATPGEMKSVLSLLNGQIDDASKQESSKEVSNPLSDSVISSLYRYPRLTWIYYIGGFLFLFFVPFAGLYPNYVQTVLACPLLSSPISFDCTSADSLLLIAGLAIAAVHKAIRDRTRFQNIRQAVNASRI
ncbi:MAG: hypothetical protein ACRECH_13220 [Nitrososphaerales archaeon]